MNCACTQLQSKSYCTQAVLDNINKNYTAGLGQLNATLFASAFTITALSQDPVGAPVEFGREAIEKGMQEVKCLIL
eukprot:2977183-Rhodomonas_salina.1